MLDQFRLVHYLRFFAGALVVTWIIVQFGGTGDQHNQYADLFRQFRDQRKVFISDFLNHDISGAYVGDGLSDLCSAKTWTPGLILTCDAVPGGMADVKNGILTCIRVAIEIGAEVILPDIMLRSTMDLSIIAPHDKGPRRGLPPSHFFDTEYLMDTLGEFCPELKIHNSLNDFFDEPSLLEPAKLDIYKVPGVKIAANLGKSAGKLVSDGDKLGQQIHAMLNKKSPPKTRRYPFRVDLRPTPSYMMPAFADQPPLRRYFGRMLRVRKDMRALAATVLFNLQKAFDLQIDPRKGIDIDAFVGVELRTLPDPLRFPDYTEQASDALSFVVANNLSQIYLTEGATKENITSFTERCRDFNIAVITKEDLVEGADAALLASLSYDERFLVDYEVALRAGLFMGNAQSSFTWSVGLRREFAFGQAGSSNSSHLNGTLRWHNQYSTIYGKNFIGDDLRRAIWP
ncbi:hypothetical protein SPBR_00591 [Sporothrix brasiliensis 5110]|uniref:Alternative oxidase n=1 Tax=Sporothrix brasiliensis 5110 TaxID=1398154 RepID=A0A0C2IUF8_9PEZI|nr:uncharacterized protein SPBR_00591 [Sporothrix brasiliensis 5110]KIH90395.1 hypothetical protein SPBR_00591 [Sporothrix brasiliensis 5110]